MKRQQLQPRPSKFCVSYVLDFEGGEQVKSWNERAFSLREGKREINVYAMRHFETYSKESRLVPLIRTSLRWISTVLYIT